MTVSFRTAIRALIASTALVANASGGQVQARQAAPDGSAEADQGESGGEILVTARKKSENLRDVPVAIEVLSSQELADKNIARLTDLVALAPSFTLSLAANQPLTFLRGFGSAGNPSFEQSVGKFVDNVSFARDFQARIPVYDIERIEVLKGPQVLLYGNSATAGAISMVTRKPGRDLAADLSVSYEFNNNEVMVQGGVTAPLGDDASLRVAGFYQDLDRGWIYNAGNGRWEPTFHNWGLRGSLRLAPSGSVTINLKAEVDRVRDKGSTSQPITQSVVPIRQMPDVVLDDRRNVNYNVAPFFIEEYAALNAEIYQGDVVFDLGGAELVSTTAYTVNHQGSASSNGSNAPTVIPTFDQRYDQFSQELRLSGEAGMVRYLVGGYFQSDSYDFYSFQPLDLAAYSLPVAPFTRVSTANQDSRSYSLFGELTIQLDPSLSVSAGGRYSILRRTTDQAALAANFFGGITFDTPLSAGVSQINPSLNGLYTAVLGGIPHSFSDIKTREEHFQPQVIVQYRTPDDTMLYAKFVQGDKAGGVDVFYHGSVARGANPQDAQFRPEQATSFEAGIKGRVADNRLSYAFNLFSTTFKDLQTGVFVGTSIFTTNAGKARTRGAELDLAWTPDDAWRVTGTGTYLDAEYLDYPGATCTVGGTLAGTCSAALGGQDLSGHPTPFASKFTGTLGVEHAGDIGDLTTKAGVSVIYRSRYNTSLNDDPLGDQKGYASIDAHADLGFAGGRVTASLFGRNLGNVLYKEYGTATPLVPGSFLAFVGRGRQIGIRLSARY